LPARGREMQWIQVCEAITLINAATTRRQEIAVDDPTINGIQLHRLILTLVPDLWTDSYLSDMPNVLMWGIGRHDPDENLNTKLDDTQANDSWLWRSAIPIPIIRNSSGMGLDGNFLNPCNGEYPVAMDVPLRSGRGTNLDRNTSISIFAKLCLEPTSGTVQLIMQYWLLASAPA